MLCEPNIFEASVINFGFLTAAELIDILSAPFLNSISMSFIVFIPPEQ